MIISIPGIVLSMPFNPFHNGKGDSIVIEDSGIIVVSKQHDHSVPKNVCDVSGERLVAAGIDRSDLLKWFAKLIDTFHANPEGTANTHYTYEHKLVVGVPANEPATVTAETSDERVGSVLNVGKTMYSIKQVPGYGAIESMTMEQRVLLNRALDGCVKSTAFRQSNGPTMREANFALVSCWNDWALLEVTVLFGEYRNKVYVGVNVSGSDDVDICFDLVNSIHDAIERSHNRRENLTVIRFPKYQNAKATTIVNKAKTRFDRLLKCKADLALYGVRIGDRASTQAIGNIHPGWYDGLVKFLNTDIDSDYEIPVWLVTGDSWVGDKGNPVNFDYDKFTDDSAPFIKAVNRALKRMSQRHQEVIDVFHHHPDVERFLPSYDFSTYRLLPKYAELDRYQPVDVHVPAEVEVDQSMLDTLKAISDASMCEYYFERLPGAVHPEVIHVIFHAKLPPGGYLVEVFVNGKHTTFGNTPILGGDFVKDCIALYHAKAERDGLLTLDGARLGPLKWSGESTWHPSEHDHSAGELATDYTRIRADMAAHLVSVSLANVGEFSNLIPSGLNDLVRFVNRPLALAYPETAKDEKALKELKDAQLHFIWDPLTGAFKDADANLVADISIDGGDPIFDLMVKACQKAIQLASEIEPVHMRMIDRTDQIGHPGLARLFAPDTPEGTIYFGYHNRFARVSEEYQTRLIEYIEKHGNQGGVLPVSACLHMLFEYAGYVFFVYEGKSTWLVYAPVSLPIEDLVTRFGSMLAPDVTDASVGGILDLTGEPGHWDGVKEPTPGRKLASMLLHLKNQIASLGTGLYLDYLVLRTNSKHRPNSIVSMMVYLNTPKATESQISVRRWHVYGEAGGEQAVDYGSFYREHGVPAVLLVIRKHLEALAVSLDSNIPFPNSKKEVEQDVTMKTDLDHGMFKPAQASAHYLATTPIKVKESVPAEQPPKSNYATLPPAQAIVRAKKVKATSSRVIKLIEEIKAGKVMFSMNNEAPIGFTAYQEMGTALYNLTSFVPADQPHVAGQTCISLTVVGDVLELGGKDYFAIEVDVNDIWRGTMLVAAKWVAVVDGAAILLDMVSNDPNFTASHENGGVLLLDHVGACDKSQMGEFLLLKSACTLLSFLRIKLIKASGLNVTAPRAALMVDYMNSGEGDYNPPPRGELHVVSDSKIIPDLQLSEDFTNARLDAAFPDGNTRTAYHLKHIAENILPVAAAGRERQLCSKYYVTASLPPDLMMYSVKCKKFCDSLGCKVNWMGATARDKLELENLLSNHGEFDSSPTKYYANLYAVPDGVYLEVISLEKYVVIYPLTKLTCSVYAWTPDKIMAVYPHVMAAIVADQSL